MTSRPTLNPPYAVGVTSKVKAEPLEDSQPCAALTGDASAEEVSKGVP